MITKKEIKDEKEKMNAKFKFLCFEDGDIIQYINRKKEVMKNNVDKTSLNDIREGEE